MRFTEVAIISILCCSVRTVSPVHIQCLHYEGQAVSAVCSEYCVYRIKNFWCSRMKDKVTSVFYCVEIFFYLTILLW